MGRFVRKNKLWFIVYNRINQGGIISSAVHGGTAKIVKLFIIFIVHPLLGVMKENYGGPCTLVIRLSGSPTRVNTKRREVGVVRHRGWTKSGQLTRANRYYRLAAFFFRAGLRFSWEGIYAALIRVNRWEEKDWLTRRPGGGHHISRYVYE